MPNATDRAYQEVVDGILSGAHAMGGPLREEKLASKLGMSRTPVREALRRLQSDGLVEFLPNRGALVTRWGAEDLDEIFDLRALLEGYGARRAAAAIDADQLSELPPLCVEMERLAEQRGPEEHVQITRVNLQFHRHVHIAAHNPRLLQALSQLIQLPLVHHTFHHYTADELTRSFAHHRELIAALRAQDPDWAEHIMHSHVHAARASLRRARDETTEPEVSDG